MPTRSSKNIERIFLEGTEIDQAVDESVRQAVRRHKLLGNPIVVWRDGRAVWVRPDDVPAEDGQAGNRSR